MCHSCQRWNWRLAGQKAIPATAFLFKPGVLLRSAEQGLLFGSRHANTSDRSFVHRVLWALRL